MLLWLLLGAIQGITEWLPISSKTQVMLFGIAELGLSPAEAFSTGLALQGGTALAAIYAFRHDVANLAMALPHIFSNEGEDVAELRILAMMTAMTGIIGLPLLLLYRALLVSWSIGSATLLMGLTLLFTALMLKLRGKGSRGRRPSLLDGILGGIAQGLSVLPGISRSGMTLALFGLRGLGSEESFRLSFLASIPATLGSSVMALITDGALPGFMGTGLLISAGFALIVGFAAIRLLLNASRSAGMDLLCAVLGILTVAWSLLSY